MADLSKQRDEQDEFKPEGVLINEMVSSLENNKGKETK